MNLINCYLFLKIQLLFSFIDASGTKDIKDKKKESVRLFIVLDLRNLILFLFVWMYVNSHFNF